MDLNCRVLVCLFCRVINLLLLRRSKCNLSRVEHYKRCTSFKLRLKSIIVVCNLFALDITSFLYNFINCHLEDPYHIIYLLSNEHHYLFIVFIKKTIFNLFELFFKILIKTFREVKKQNKGDLLIFYKIVLLKVYFEHKLGR